MKYNEFQLVVGKYYRWNDMDSLGLILYKSPIFFYIVFLDHANVFKFHMDTNEFWTSV